LLQHAQALSEWEAEIQEIVKGDAFVSTTGTLNFDERETECMTELFKFFNVFCSGSC
jgi:hypothetical protein